ncbi:MAG: hypothetical protein HFG67_04275 [Firmicutes bacterium]|nr:hypothetical protein [Bacillota bacterium]
MNRIFERAGVYEETREAVINEKIKVGIAGCGCRAGASFTATSLAVLAARTSDRRVAFVQSDADMYKFEFPINARKFCKLQKTNLYDALGMDKRFAGRHFTDFFGLIERGMSIRNIRNVDEQINWALRIPVSGNSYIGPSQYECLSNNGKAKEVAQIHDGILDKESSMLFSEELQYREEEYLILARLINNVAGDFTVCDFGSGQFADFKNPLYLDMDTLVCVLDPLPSKLLESADMINEIRLMEAKGQKIIWILNKDNGGVNRRELRDFLGNILSRAYVIPLMDERLFYSAEYNCEIPFDKREIHEKTKSVFGEILQKIFAA